MHSHFGRTALILALTVAGSLLVPLRADAAVRTYPSPACLQSATGLNDCIATLPDGSTVNVKPGVYHERFDAPSAVTVAGPCKGKPAVLDTSGLGSAAKILHDDVTLKCMTFRNGLGMAFGVNNLVGSYNNLHIMRLKVSKYDVGIRSDGGNGLIVKGSTFSSMAGDGINVGGPSAGSTLSGNTVTNVQGNCMILDGITTSTISSNNISRCGAYGLWMQGTGGANTNKVLNNNITTIKTFGMSVESSSSTISGNRVSRTGDVAIQSTGASNKITGNNVGGHSDSDAYNVFGTGVTIMKNRAVGPSGYFIHCDPCDSGLIQQNTVTQAVGADGINAAGASLNVSNNKILGGGHGMGIIVSGATPVVDGNTIKGGFGSPGIRFDCTSACPAASLSGNNESGTFFDFGYSVTTAGCAAPDCGTIANNIASDNSQAGFYLGTAFAKVTGNRSTGSGWGANGCDPGFIVDGSNNVLTRNFAAKNACDGFKVNGIGNKLDHNTATSNGQMGFHNEGDVAVFDHNVAKNNTGDGLNNDSTGATFTNNTSSGNRQDCTNDTTEGGTTTTVSGNACADGTNFGPTDESTLSDID